MDFVKPTEFPYADMLHDGCFVEVYEATVPYSDEEATRVLKHLLNLGLSDPQTQLIPEEGIQDNNVREWLAVVKKIKFFNMTASLVRMCMEKSGLRGDAKFGEEAYVAPETENVDGYFDPPYAQLMSELDARRVEQLLQARTDKKECLQGILKKVLGDPEAQLIPVEMLPQDDAAGWELLMRKLKFLKKIGVMLEQEMDERAAKKVKRV